MVHVRRWMPLACAIALVACDEPMQPATPEASPEFSHGLVSTTSGAGTIDLTTANAGLARFVFTALQFPNGPALGNFYQFREAGGLTVEFSGEVTCVSFDPVNNRAWIAGTIKQNLSTNPAFQVDTLHTPGLDIWFRMVDYGEGEQQAQPDRSTVFGFKGSAGIVTSAEYCATKPWPAADARTFPISKGNLQVRP